MPLPIIGVQSHATTFGLLRNDADVRPPLKTGLISYWTLDEASGTRNDSFGTNHLTDNNTVTQATGKKGNAAQFTAANSEWLSVTDNASLSMGDIDFTFAAWLYPDNIASAIMTVLSKIASNASNALEYKIETRTTGDLFFYVSNGAGTIASAAAAAGSLASGTWAFMVCWHDSIANTINMQINNGTVVSTAFSVGSYDSTAPFEIGRTGGAANIRYWGGRIDECAVWKRTLTAVERSWLFNGGNGRTYSELR